MTFVTPTVPDSQVDAPRLLQSFSSNRLISVAAARQTLGGSHQLVERNFHLLVVGLARRKNVLVVMIADARAENGEPTMDAR